MKKPIDPPSVISPTRSPASVNRPWAPAPDVAANTRITSRPPNPTTSRPATKPAVNTHANVRSASNAADEGLVGESRRAANRKAAAAPRDRCCSGDRGGADHHQEDIVDAHSHSQLAIRGRSPAHSNSAARMGIEHERSDQPHLIDGVEPVEMTDVIGEVKDALDQPSDCDDRHRLATPDGPRRHDDQCEEQHADITDQVLVVDPTLRRNPTAAEREILEPRFGSEGGLDRRGSMNSPIRAKDHR